MKQFWISSGLRKFMAQKLKAMLYRALQFRKRCEPSRRRARRSQMNVKNLFYLKNIYMTNKIITETVFEIGAECGSINIFRQQNGSIELFAMKLNEFDPFENEPSVNIEKVFKTFDLTFHEIDSKYPWYSLCILGVHQDYKAFIIERLTDRLQERTSIPEALRTSEDLHTIYHISKNLKNSLRDWKRH